MNRTEIVAGYADRARQQNAQYFIHACDTFSNEDYPVFCEDASTVVTKHAQLNGMNMQRVEGVYGADGSPADMAKLRELAASAPTRTSSPAKTYLGDGLYASHDGFQVTLSAENGAESTNTVHLEPEVLAAFVKFLRANNIQL